jgi:hypothetical protein
VAELTPVEDPSDPDDAEFITLDEALERNEFGNYGDNSLYRMAHMCLMASAPKSALVDANDSKGILIIEVPAEDWLVPIGMAVRAIWRNSSVRTYGGGKAGKLTNAAELLPRHLNGHGLVLVSDAADDAIPAVLIDAAVQRFRVSPPSKRDFLKVARSLLEGDVNSAFANLEIKGVGFTALCTTLVKADTADNAALKLAKILGRIPLAPVDDNVPCLDQVQGFGKAAEWANALKLDLQQFRAGRLGWEQVDNSAILFGQPGVGKSFFARITAKHCGLPIIVTSVSDFFQGNGYLDSVLKRQREAFRRAAEQAPALLFIDEIDAMPSRDVKSHNTDFWRPVITDFLLQLDSVKTDKHGVVVLAATNRIMDIDPAIIRSGRMGTLLHVPAPNAEALAGIFRYHLKSDLPEADLLPLARQAVGSTGADVAAWVAAARRAARMASRAMMIDDLVLQVLGNDQRSEARLRRVAAHEAGHAVAAVVCGVDITSVSIVLRDTTAGHTLMRAPPDLMSLREIEGFVVSILAGRAAEAVLLGEPSAGAGGSATSDLALATKWVQSLHTSFGLKDNLTWSGDPGDDPDHMTLDTAVKNAVESDLRRLYGLSVGIVMTHREAVMRVVEVLLKEKVVAGTRIAEILETQRLTN